MRSRLALLSVLPAVVVACVAPHVWAPHEANASSGSPSWGLVDPVVDSASAVDTNAIIVVSARSYSVPPGGGLPIASHVEALDGAVQPLSRNDLKGLNAPSTALLRPDPPLSPATDYVLVVENALTPNPGGPPVYETKKVPFRTGTGPRAITPLQIAECGQPSLRRYPSITPRACCEPEPGTCAGGTCHLCVPSELVSREVRSIVWSGGSTSKSRLQHLLVVETNRAVDEESYEWRLEEGKRVYDLYNLKSVAVPMATCESMCVRAKTVDLLTGDEGVSEPLCFSTTLALEGPVPACGQAATLLSRDTCTPEPALTAVATSCGIGAGGSAGGTTWDGSGGTSGCGDPTGPSGGTSGAPPLPPPPKAPVCAPGGGGAAGVGAGGGGG